MRMHCICRLNINCLSVCVLEYQPERSSIVIAVSPLLALMTDQVNIYVYVNTWACNHLHGFNVHHLLQMS